ncbi:hypothetical protein BDK51DRAFT_43774 [Blyttiomyces helicus]|uniref:PA domain-containing protein n=1 Tax=Blyttiomyces helicus TaxID=388810 RepID=A0A4P9WAK8_9FUNG|nr:hypothetical protein BDK51DRAFT_43774 [Blyttiomyces helicus]|eukprot:RKO87276.1 hypothetical protein BDK51DRAFT_43774 [Blyttiomyces helicus]
MCVSTLYPGTEALLSEGGASSSTKAPSPSTSAFIFIESPDLPRHPSQQDFGRKLLLPSPIEPLLVPPKVPPPHLQKTLPLHSPVRWNCPLKTLLPSLRLPAPLETRLKRRFRRTTALLAPFWLLLHPSRPVAEPTGLRRGTPFRCLEKVRVGTLLAPTPLIPPDGVGSRPVATILPPDGPPGAESTRSAFPVSVSALSSSFVRVRWIVEGRVVVGAGNATFSHRSAAFGPPISEDGLRARILAPSDTETSPHPPTAPLPPASKGCTPVYPPSQTPWIALVQRGECSFIQKVRAMQRSGAIAVVVGDLEKSTSGLVTMFANGDTADIDIPSVFISGYDFTRLRKMIWASRSGFVEVTLIGGDSEVRMDCG